MWTACSVMGQILCFPLPLGLISSENGSNGLVGAESCVSDSLVDIVSPQALWGLESVIRSLMVIVSDDIHQRIKKASALLESADFSVKNLANSDGLSVFHYIWLLECKKDHKSAVFLWLWLIGGLSLESLEHPSRIFD